MPNRKTRFRQALERGISLQDIGDWIKGQQRTSQQRVEQAYEKGATDILTGVVARQREMGRQRERELAEWVVIFERFLIMARLSPPLRKRHKD